MFLDFGVLGAIKKGKGALFMREISLWKIKYDFYDSHLERVNFITLIGNM